MRVSFLTCLYLECSYEDLRCLRNKINMPEGKPIRISSTFSQMCKKKQNRTFWTLHSEKKHELWNAYFDFCT